MERITFKINVPLSPVFINTATGGSKTQRTIVRIDIVCLFIGFNE